MADQVSSLSPQLAARPGAGNRTEVIVATDGKPVPEGGYDDCAICQAKTAEEREALMLKIGETVH